MFAAMVGVATCLGLLARHTRPLAIKPSADQVPVNSSHALRVPGGNLVTSADQSEYDLSVWKFERTLRLACREITGIVPKISSSGESILILHAMGKF